MSPLTEAGWESVRRALAFARADDERRAQAGRCATEEYPSLLELDDDAVRHFFCHKGYNRLPEYRVYAREFTIAYGVSVLSSDPIASHRLRTFRVVCRLEEVQRVDGTISLELQGRCWGSCRDRVRWTFRPREETALRVLNTLQSCLRPPEIWRSIYWLDENSWCFSVDYLGKLTPDYIKANRVQHRPFTVLKIDDIPVARDRAGQVNRFAFGQLPIAG